MKKFIIFLFLFSFVFSFFLTSELNPVHAQWDALLGSCDTVDKKGNPGGSVVTLDCAPKLFSNVIYWALIMSGTIAIIIIIISGIKFISSGGDPKQAEGAKKTLTWAVIGLLVILLSFGVLRLIADITGVGCITKFGFTQCVPGNALRCGTNGNPGWCPINKKCIFEAGGGGRYICKTPCGTASGWCSGTQKCVQRDGRPGYKCIPR